MTTCTQKSTLKTTRVVSHPEETEVSARMLKNAARIARAMFYVGIHLQRSPVLFILHVGWRVVK